MPMGTITQLTWNQLRANLVGDYNSALVSLVTEPTIMIQEHKGFPKVSKSECSNFLYPSSCHPSIPLLFPRSEQWLPFQFSSSQVILLIPADSFGIPRHVLLSVKNFHCAPKHSDCYPSHPAYTSFHASLSLVTTQGQVWQSSSMSCYCTPLQTFLNKQRSIGIWFSPITSCLSLTLYFLGVCIWANGTIIHAQLLKPGKAQFSKRKVMTCV